MAIFQSDFTQNARKRARGDFTCSVIRVYRRRPWCYGVWLYGYVQRRSSHRKIFSLLTFPPRSLSRSMRPLRSVFYVLLFSSSLPEPLHPRAIYESGERHAPARFMPRPVEWARHRFTYGISRSPRFDSDPPRIRDTYDTSILPKIIRFEGISLARNTRDKLKCLCSF